MSTKDEPDTIRAAVVAEMLDVSVDTVYHWAATQNLPSFRYGPRTIRFSRAAVLAWMEGRKSAVGAPATDKPKVEDVAPPVAIPGWDGVRRSKARLV